MNVIRGILPIAVVMAGVLAFVVLSRGKEVASRAPEEKKAPLVETQEAMLHTDGLDIEVDGNVVPFRDVEVSAEVAGRVIRKFPACETGEYVTKGTPLFEIDPQDYELEVKRLEKQKAQAEHDLAEMQVQIVNTEKQIELARENLDLQRKELDRNRGLYDKGVITESDFEAAKRTELMARDSLLDDWSQLRVFRSRKDRLEAARDVVEVQLKRARVDLGRASVESPIDGVIINESVEQDGFVQKSAVLVTIQDTKRMEVKCNLRVEDVYWILQQSPPESGDDSQMQHGRAFKVPATPTQVVFEEVFAWDGVLERLDGVGLDAKTRLVPCRIVVENPLDVKYIGSADESNQPTGPSALLRNMYVQLKIMTKPRTKLMRVSDEALRPGSTVWVARDGKLAILPVTIVKRWHDKVLLDASASKLQAGDRVIVSPLAGARPGIDVREMQTNQPSKTVEQH
ncbi:MAG: HlyD family efflux transporter periplasmic adaptor subunit [Pirellulales bacterium]|nr:HlyD family efflux transporter periplasmic adaptor subunit [Pirellulales bacterium]